MVDENAVIHNYKTMVHDTNADSLVLLAPLAEGAVVRLPEGSEVNLTQDSSPKAYAAMVQVIETKPGEPPLLYTTQPQKIAKVSRRRFFRVEVDLPMSAGGVSGRVTNLSGSGLMALVPTGLAKEGGPLEVKLELPGLPAPLPLRGKVVRLTKANDAERVAVHFTSLTERIRDEIIRYVTARQRELLSLGLLIRPEEPGVASTG